jgi:hypothetical protein
MTNLALGWVSFGNTETCSIRTDLRPDLVTEGMVHLADGSESSIQIYIRATA